MNSVAAAICSQPQTQLSELFRFLTWKPTISQVHVFRLRGIHTEKHGGSGLFSSKRTRPTLFISALNVMILNIRAFIFLLCVTWVFTASGNMIASISTSPYSKSLLFTSSCSHPEPLNFTQVHFYTYKYISLLKGVYYVNILYLNFQSMAFFHSLVYLWISPVWDWFYLILSYLILSYLILSYLIISYLILSYLISSLTNTITYFWTFPVQ